MNLCCVQQHGGIWLLSLWVIWTHFRKTGYMWDIVQITKGTSGPKTACTALEHIRTCKGQVIIWCIYGEDMICPILYRFGLEHGHQVSCCLDSRLATWLQAEVMEYGGVVKQVLQAALAGKKYFLEVILQTLCTQSFNVI
jgi:hypothetical protein